MKRRRLFKLLQYALLGSLVAFTGFAEDQTTKEAERAKKEEQKIPPGLKTYMGRKIAQTMHFTGANWLVRESRQREEDCSTMLKQLKVKSGMVICDMGCGNGFYSLKLAKMVGEKGSILGVDIQKEMLEKLMKRAKDAGVTNIKPILGTLIDPKLPTGKVDLMLMVDVYHEFSHPVHMLRATRKSLKPKGRIALVEFRLEDKKVPIKLLHKMSKKQIMKEFPANGFKLVEEFGGLPWQHLMFFERDENYKETTTAKE